MKKKIITGICAGVGVVLVAVILIMVFKKEDVEVYNKESVDDILDVVSQVEGLDKYSNLIMQDFTVPDNEIEGLYNIEIQSDNAYLDNTFSENFEIMNGMINKFFSEDFDRSFVVAELVTNTDEPETINYYDIKDLESYNDSKLKWLWGQAENGTFIQIDTRLRNIWFSRYEFGTSQPPNSNGFKEVFKYISGQRQEEDSVLNLRDGEIQLSEMEDKVLEFLNENFIIEYPDNISFCIGEARIVTYRGEDGICFYPRRVYKGVPFEYGDLGIYNDTYDNEHGQISYSESGYIEGMCAFGSINGTLVETSEITEVIPLNDAMKMLSEHIGTNSTYDVYGIELVYRECVISEYLPEGVEEILKPVWKFITINQNDNKYTLFYVDVVTGEITERFECYYE